MGRFVAFACAMVAGPLLLGGVAPAVGSEAVEIGDKLIGKPKADGGFKRAEDLSGIACAEPSGFPRHCLLVDDDSQFAQFVTLEDGEITAGEKVRLTDATFAGEPLEFDGEGVAFDCGSFYVVGSYGHPRDKDRELLGPVHAPEVRARIAADSAIVRVPAEVGAVARPSDCQSSPLRTTADRIDLRKLLQDDPEISMFVDERLEKNGLTIEGIAIRKGVLYAGLRAPILRGNRAVILAVDLTKGADAPKVQRIELSLGKCRGVRDLASYGDGLLILAGPSADPDKTDPIGKKDYKVFYWNLADDPEELGSIGGVEFDSGKWAKPEALLPLKSRDGELELLVLFDGAPKSSAARIDTVDAP